MAHLYITDNGAVLGINGGRYTVKSKSALIRSIPKETVEMVSIFGNSTITTQGIHRLLEDGIPVNFFSGRGKYYGKLQSPAGIGEKIGLVRKQFRIFENNNFCLTLAKKVASAKIHNQRVLLSRYRKRKDAYAEEIERLSILERKIYVSMTTQQVMGFEGSAARIYFNALGGIVDPAFCFEKRTRRPPKDAFNSMLSLGYTILANEITAAIDATGLSPYCGFLHAERSGNPVLAFDMIEEWRAPLIDAVVLSLVNGHEIRKSDFIEDGEGAGIFLTNRGLDTFIRKLERKMVTTTKYLEYEYEQEKDSSFRESLLRQCHILKLCVVEENANLYQPFRLR